MNLLPLGLKDGEATAASGKHTSPPASEVKDQGPKTAINIPVNTRNYLCGIGLQGFGSDRCFISGKPRTVSIQSRLFSASCYQAHAGSTSVP